MSSSLPLSLNPPLFNRLQFSPLDSSHSNIIAVFPLLVSKYSLQPSKSHICFAISSSDNSNFEREEERWLREEQRWLREEERWLREEQRWKAERESLVWEIEALKHKIEELENGENSNLNVGGLLQVLKKEVSRIAERGSSAAPLVVESLEAAPEVEAEAEEARAEEAEVKEVVTVFESTTIRNDEVNKKRVTLRRGSEGDEVRVMQEALEKLGFYCGDEDTEYSMFSSGTERAIKTWQATLRIPEDGIMTAELLDKLYGDKRYDVSGLAEKADIRTDDAADLPKASNGAAITSTTEVSKIQKRNVEEKSVPEPEVFRNRVYLLGENRWEEPSRLIGRNMQVGGGTSTDATRCISCRGEGRVLCSECDGTGEPNIEEQFMEWVDEGAKCPYCDGLGYSTCDVCDGEKVV